MFRSYRLSCVVVIALLSLGACRTPPAELPETGLSGTELPGTGLPDTLPSETPDAASPGDTAETRPRQVQRDQLTITLTRADLELDPRKSYIASEAQLYTALYEGLFSYHPYTMEPVLAVAEKWELSEDKKTWTFRIRNDARYWNGDPVRAQDFRDAWISLLEPRRQSPYSSLFDVIKGAWEYRTGRTADPSGIGIETTGDRTLIVHLTAPASFFPSMLCHHSFSPVHPSMLNKDNWSKAAPISNGPFYISSSDAIGTEPESLLLTKNTQYWDAGRVSLNQVTVLYTDDADEASALWNSGQARWIGGTVNIDSLTDLSGIVVNPMFATHYYFIRSSEEPWTDYRLRRALILALPWEELREGQYLPAKTLIYPILGYPEVEGLEDTDIEEALRLLEEAGYPRGEGLPELVIRLAPYAEAARIGELMAVAWKEQLGVPVRIEVVPERLYLQSLRSPGYGVGSSTWIGDFADPYTFLPMWRRDSNLNDAGLNDADYEELLEKSMGQEGTERYATLAEAEKLLLDRGTVIPISHSLTVNIVDTGELDGWYPNALDIHPFKYFSFKAFRPLPGVAMLH
ncbi:MAG: peptide ABC transporter substrate-binding protein [Treponema sp.]|jgi:peptide/nickel transport system substrate-binding protein/oligopeptide transport system substrate-binding protein|nr:peptide ABC transporter substrate-binding protein [Treponema sp.]